MRADAADPVTVPARWSVGPVGAENPSASSSHESVLVDDAAQNVVSSQPGHIRLETRGRRPGQVSRSLLVQ